MNEFLTTRTERFLEVTDDRQQAHRWAMLTAAWPEKLVQAVIAWKQLEQLAPAWYWLMIERTALSGETESTNQEV